jgi:hypothetical protein
MSLSINDRKAALPDFVVVQRLPFKFHAEDFGSGDVFEIGHRLLQDIITQVVGNLSKVLQCIEWFSKFLHGSTPVIQYPPIQTANG